MKCPIDGVELVMTDRQGIEIDYCPQCRGIWLDRGELDKMIERSQSAPSFGGADAGRSQDHDSRERGHDSRERGKGHGGGHGDGRRRGGIFDIFDF